MNKYIIIFIVILISSVAYLLNQNQQLSVKYKTSIENIKAYGAQLPVLMTYKNIDSTLKLGANTRIGYDTSVSNRYLNGYIQQVMIFDRALSPDEIRKYYNNGNGMGL